MSMNSLRIFILMATAISTMPALADDCAITARNAMLATYRNPVSTITTKISADGKRSVSRTVQTEAVKYVQLPSGEWYAMDISIKQLMDNAAAEKVTCRRSGSDLVGGLPTIFYELHVESDLVSSDLKIWVSSKHQVVKSEGGAEDGAHFTTLYDNSHVTPPAHAKRMGDR